MYYSQLNVTSGFKNNVNHRVKVLYSTCNQMMLVISYDLMSGHVHTQILRATVHNACTSVCVKVFTVSYTVYRSTLSDVFSLMRAGWMDARRSFI